MDAVSNGSILDLPERLDSSVARDLYTQIDAHKDNHLGVNGAAVTYIGGLCLQVLIAAKEEWARNEKSFSIQSASETLSTFLGTIGREDLLEPETACP